MKDRFKRHFGFSVPSVVTTPRLVRVDDVIFRQHLERVENEVSGTHAEVVRGQHEATTVTLGYDQDHDYRVGFKSHYIIHIDIIDVGVPTNYAYVLNN